MQVADLVAHLHLGRDQIDLVLDRVFDRHEVRVDDLDQLEPSLSTGVVVFAANRSDR